MLRPLLSPLCIGLLAAMLAVGCSKTQKPPPPLPVAQMAAELKKAWPAAPPGLQEILNQVTTALDKKDYPSAYQGVQILTSMPNATPEQRMLATRAMLTLTSELQSAAAAGDQNAAAALKSQRINK